MYLFVMASIVIPIRDEALGIGTDYASIRLCFPTDAGLYSNKLHYIYALECTEPARVHIANVCEACGAHK